MINMSVDLPEYSLEADSQAIIGNPVKTWRWPLPAGDFPAPDSIDPLFFHCRSCSRPHDLAPFVYEGNTLYICRSCGNVYEIFRDPGKPWKDPFRTWHLLFEQPYKWTYFKGLTSLGYCFMHESGAMGKHPLIDAHCNGDRSDSLELIVRFLAYILTSLNLRLDFFGREITDITVSGDDDSLILSSGKYSDSFLSNIFCVYREESNRLTLEASDHWDENIFGYTADCNLEDWEMHAGYLFLRLTFLGNDSSDLSCRARKLLEDTGKNLPAACREKDIVTRRRIVREPFGLNGFYLYERMQIERCLGTWADD